jgi:peptidoglycan/LPS O-acetylase OafA/YrhL
MLGSFRLLLALLVVMAHLAEGTTFVSHMGVFAVFGFYVISGYLMTLVLHEVYHFDFSSFWANRFLRLFPTYYLVALASLLVVIHYCPTRFMSVCSQRQY